MKDDERTKPVLVFSQRADQRSPLSQQERALLSLFRLCDADRRDRLLAFAKTAAECACLERDEGSAR
jgi:hypothetical protein